MLFGRSKAPLDFIIVGLGNPGAQYDKSRHNTGFRAVDYISGRAGIAVNRLRHMAKTGTGLIAGKKVLIMKPQTYMNASGQAVADASRFYKIPPENILVIFDDVSLDVGRIRIRRSGSDGGHNGVKSVTEHLGTEVFPRIKIGVGAKPNPEYDLADWVLSELSVSERNAIAEKYDSIYEAVSLIINGDIEKAMQMCN